MRRYSFADFLVYLIEIIIGIVEFLVLLRIILKLFAANPNTPFVAWVYETTRGLIWPFLGMFPAPTLDNGFVIEFSAIFALIVYAIVGYFITELIRYISFNSGRYRVVREVREVP